jgi:ubiquinone/menaquinone biosynthesis C-methylase UbiE
LDISEVMIEKAIEFNKNIRNCTFEEINGISLSNFNDGSSDFILSIITLQHLNEEVQLAYLKEFFRILSAKGILYFQTVTSYSNSFYGLLKRFTKNKIANYYNKYRYKLKSPIEMHICRESEISKLVDQYDIKIISKYNDKRAGKSLISCCYILQKNN